jgi:hypothetical protein
MDYSKIIGWIVFAGGLAIIVWTLVFSYNIFTGKAEIPVFFDQEDQIQETTSSDNLEDRIGEMAREEIKNLIPLNAVSTILNLAVWSVFAFIFVFGGFQIASLGIKLVKKQ